MRCKTKPEAVNAAATQPAITTTGQDGFLSGYLCGIITGAFGVLQSIACTDQTLNYQPHTQARISGSTRFKMKRTDYNMSDNSELIQKMRAMAHNGGKASQILRFLVIDQGIEQQMSLMELFRDAFITPLGSITAIGAWWHEGDRELDDDAIDSYIGYVIEDFLALHSDQST